MLQFYDSRRIPPPLAMLIAAATMWVLHHWLPLGQLLALPWNYVALVPAVGSRMISVDAGRRFRANRTTFDPLQPQQTSYLVTDGVYRFSRNPMYAGLVLMLVAWALWLGTLSPWLVPPAFAWLLAVTHIAPEERALEEVFGDRYRAYRSSVRRWIGRK